MFGSKPFAFGFELRAIVSSLWQAGVEDDLAGVLRISDALLLLHAFDVPRAFGEGFDLAPGISSELERTVRSAGDSVAYLLNVARQLAHIDRIDEVARLHHLVRVEASPLTAGELGGVHDEKVVMELGHGPVLPAD